MSAPTFELRCEAKGKTGDVVRTSSGDGLDFVVRGFVLFAVAYVEPGETATLSVTRIEAEA